MRKDFDEKLRFEKQPILNYLKKNSWNFFLEKWAASNPFSKEDESLRQRANLKINSYSLKKNTATTDVSDCEKLLPKQTNPIRTTIRNYSDLKNNQTRTSQNPFKRTKNTLTELRKAYVEAYKENKLFIEQ